MERKALKDLERWRQSKSRKPLIIWGARQVGKTYLIKELFAERYFKKRYVYIDLRLDAEIRDYCETTVNPKEMIAFISAVRNVRISSDTLLIFDEAQECPSVITSLKYFCQDFRDIPVIVTGSMVRIKIKRINNKRGVGKQDAFLFPVGKINQITLYPMTFGEFLLNHNAALFETIVNAYQKKRPLNAALHEVALSELYRYLMLGGMPEALSIFFQEESYRDAGIALKDLYDNYLADMELYQASPEAIVRSRKIFQSIFKELNKENKNFKSSMIEERARLRDLKQPVDWLTMAHVVHQSYQLNESVTLPLMENNELKYRLYLGDIGMFSYQSGLGAATFLSKKERNALSGIFFENYVANELVAEDHRLFFWKGRTSAELEFIVETAGEIFPIDVKRGRGKMRSLEKYREHNRLKAAIKISENNYGFDKENKILTIPLYEAFLISQDLKNATLDI